MNARTWVAALLLTAAGAAGCSGGDDGSGDQEQSGLDAGDGVSPRDAGGDARSDARAQGGRDGAVEQSADAAAVDAAAQADGGAGGAIDKCQMVQGKVAADVTKIVARSGRGGEPTKGEALSLELTVENAGPGVALAKLTA